MIMILNKENQGADQNQFLPILLKFSSEKYSDICCEKYRQLDSSTVQRLQTRDDFYELSKILFWIFILAGQIKLPPVAAACSNLN